jgi:hypothetical protein
MRRKSYADMNCSVAQALLIDRETGRPLDEIRLRVVPNPEAQGEVAP